jgi:hypothetical protein
MGVSMSIEDLRGAIGEAEDLIGKGLAILQATPAQIDTVVAGLGALLKSSARLETEAAQGSLTEAAECLGKAREAALAAIEAAAQYKVWL